MMASSEATAQESEDVGKYGIWAWHPPVPLTGVPVFAWPPRIFEGLKFLISRSFLGSVLIPFGTLAAITWYFLQPALERCVELEASWILQLFARNLLLMLLVAGSLHLYFYVFKLQGTDRKFDSHDMQRDNPRFLGDNQVWDNMFWSLASGVTIWTAYEVLFFWAYANGMLPYYLEWRSNPVSFILILLAIPFWTSVHFHFIHRLLHWRPLFKIAHTVHHRNVNLGPWSGLSMHPIEHIVYLSSVLIHVVLPSHPIHILFHMQWNTLGAASGHTGFESLTFRGRPILYLPAFHHQLHHKYLDCNYGNPLVAVDKWFDCDHDGTREATAELRDRQRERRQNERNDAGKRKSDRLL